MPDKRIQDLTPATSVGLADRFVLEQSGQAKSLTGQVLITDLAAALDGHGGISGVSYTPPVAPSLDGTLTITLADNTSYDVTITNGNGISSVAVAYGNSTSGTDPSLVSEWSNTVVPPTDANPYMWTRITLTYIDGNSTVAYSVTAKAEDPTISVGSVSAVSGAAASVSITNSGTPLDATLDFDFTLPKGDKGDTGDYIEPVVSYGTSTAAATEPTTWYSSPSSISYAAGNYIWRKTDYTLHDAQTVQSTKKEIIGYIGQNGSGSGTVTQITFNGDVFSDDGTGNVPMTVDAEDVGAIADPSTKSDGQVLTWDSNANAWVAANPATGNVNTVNNVGVTAGTTNIDITGANIPVSGSDNTPISDALGATVPLSKGGTGATTAAGARANLGAVNIAGDTMTGNLYVTKAGNAYVQAENSATGAKINLDSGSSQYHGIFSYGYYDGSSFHSSGIWMIYRGGDGIIRVNGKAENVTGTVAVANGGTGATTAAGARANLGAATIPLHISTTITTSPATISNASIKDTMRIVSIQFGTPSVVTKDVTWTTSDGSLVLGDASTFSSSTTVDIILAETT